MTLESLPGYHGPVLPVVRVSYAEGGGGTSLGYVGHGQYPPADLGGMVSEVRLSMAGGGGYSFPLPVFSYKEISFPVDKEGDSAVSVYPHPSGSRCEYVYLP